MEPEGSLPHSQAPANCPYPEPDQSNPHRHPISRRTILSLSEHLCVPNGFLSSDFPTKPCMHLSCLPYFPRLLDLITRIVCDEEYRIWSSSLCSILQSPVTLSLLGPNILLVTPFWDTLCSSLNVRHQVSHPYKTYRAKLRQNFVTNITRHSQTLRCKSSLVS